MDFILDVLICVNDLKKLGLNEVLVEWGGEFFSQEPPKYKTDTKLTFVQNNNTQYYDRFFDKKINLEEFIALTLDNVHVREIERLVNQKKDELLINHAVIFLSKLSEMNRYTILLLRDEETVDEKHKVDGKEEVIRLLCKGLNWECPKGVLMEKR